MCGIAGLWRLSGADPLDMQVVGRMSALLEHRGPDDFGYLLADTAHGHTAACQGLSADFVPDLLLASRRLSILDLSPAGRQPIGNEAGDIFVVFNGAIHNYIELRQELEGFGHVFRSNTDTEVIVHAYEQWGPDCANRFNGMWAYAIWDQRQGRLVCSRDRFGVKPLLVARHGGAFYFASEAKAIIGAGVPAVPNPNFVRQFIAYSVPIMGDETAFEGITQLPAGHNLIVTASGEQQSRYWSYADRSESYDFKHPTETFRHLFDDAVRLRLRSDVPIAVLLSGGLDSSSIAVRAAKHLDRGRLQAYTSVFPGFPVDEERHARQVAERAGLDLTIVEYHEDDLLADLAAVTWALDLPPAMTQTIGRWRLLQSVSKTARIVLDGQGGDEILGGYPYRYLYHYYRSELANLRPWNLHPKLWRILAANAERKRYRTNRQAPTPYRFDPETILSADFPAERPVAGTPGPVPDFATPSRLLTQLWRDHCFLIIPHVVQFADAISMAHSVESRPPFLDHRLVEFMYGLPVDQMIRGTETKYVLRQALANDLPPAIVNRRDKMGMRPPTETWVRAKLDSQIRPLLTSDRVRDRGVFDRRGVEDCLSRVNDSAASNIMAMRCCALEFWFRQFVDREGFGQAADLAAAPA